MKKKNHLDEFRFDLHISGAENGLIIEFPSIGTGNVVLMKSQVVLSKQEALAVLEKQLDQFYNE